MKDYLRCIRSVDDSVGRILDYLDQAGLADNTMVVYTSDQGFYLGEHGWFDKRWIFQESLRTPLIVRWPGVVSPARATAATSSRTSTLPKRSAKWPAFKVPADDAGPQPGAGLQGRTPDDWRKYFYYHYYEWPAVHNVRPHYGVASDRYKLVQVLRRRELLGTVRPGKGSRGDDQRL